MNHGPFYRSAELVAGVHGAEGGIFAGFRAAHAYGRIYAGTFTATPEAKTLSRAEHFQGTPVPVTARLSGSKGDPEKKPSSRRRDGDQVLSAGRHRHRPDRHHAAGLLRAHAGRVPRVRRGAGSRPGDRRARPRQAQGVRGRATRTPAGSFGCCCISRRW